MDATTYAIDIAKSVFQVYWVEPGTGEIGRRKLSRAKLTQFLAPRAPARVAMEACGGAHQWARVFADLGLQVELLPTQKVREHASGNKDDAADARAIWLAAQQKDVRRVTPKTAQQQADLAAHRVRSHWVSLRTATTNTLRSLLYEFGLVVPKGRKILLEWVAVHRVDLEQELPAVVLQLVDQQLHALRELEGLIEAAERQIEQAQRTSTLAQRLRQVPGIGLLGATALAATLADGSAWKNAREFAACLGLVPRHTGTGGKVRMGGISKRGDPYLRTLLIHGARNLVRLSEPSEWIEQMLKRRPFNVVATAVAHKLAKTAWAMAAHDEEYQAHRRWHAAPAMA
jgi:transposase